MDLGLRDGAWLVTGGTSGLGYASASAIAAEGGGTLVVGRDPGRAEAAAARLGGNSVAVTADLADPETVDRILAVARALSAPLRGAVLSVGGPPPGTVLSTPDDAWRQSFEAVFLGPLRLARSLVQGLPDLESIVWVLSSSAKSPIAGLSISNGLRPGLAMLVKDLADELGSRGVRVNALLPGRFDTPRVRELEDASGDPAGARARMAAAIPLGRYGDPQEFGVTAAFLLSPRASYITGAVLAIDGGAARTL